MRRADDLALVRRARADRSALDRLFDRYADRVHRLARRRATADLPAETLTARMLERVFSALADYDGAHSRPSLGRPRFGGSHARVTAR